ncbi:MAG: hypothetical protein WC374_00050 [Phycisphaerae bacterium]|jgi:endonuclease III
MKDSQKYLSQVQKFYRSLKRNTAKIKKVEYEDITESLIHAAVLEYMTESVTKAAFKRFEEHFVDSNDMRVSRPEEIVEMLGQEGEDARKVGVSVITILNGIFKRYNTVNLDSLRKLGKRQARTALEKIDGVSRFCVDYCMLTALDSHSVPLTDAMVKYLRGNELVHPEADFEEIEGFLTRQISAANAYEFYSLLRRQSETKGAAAAVKRKTKTKTKTKSTKKTKGKK